MALCSFLSPWLRGCSQNRRAFELNHLMVVFSSLVPFPRVYVFSVYVQFLAILKHKAQGEYQSVQAEMCAEWVQAGFEAYRPCEVVHLRMICPSFSLVCPTLPPSSAHCAAVAWDGLQTRVEWEVWDPSHENPMVSELDARNHTGRFGVWFPKVHNIFFLCGSRNMCSGLKNKGHFWHGVCIFILFGGDAVWWKISIFLN